MTEIPKVSDFEQIPAKRMITKIDLSDYVRNTADIGLIPTKFLYLNISEFLFGEWFF